MILAQGSTTNGLAKKTYTFTYTVVGFLNNDESTFEITINPVQNTFSAISTCENGLPFEWNGLSLNEAGNYSVTLSSADTGCDSVVNLSFTVDPSLSSMTVLESCSSDLPIDWNGLSLNQEGSYSVVLTGSNGCDSTAILELSVEELELQK